AGGEHHRVADMRRDLAGDEVARDDAARHAVYDDEVQHLVARVHIHRAEPDLPRERLICAEEQLLPRLAARVEGARDLRAAERAVIEEATVFAREGDALRDALVNDVDADLGESVDICLAG